VDHKEEKGTNDVSKTLLVTRIKLGGGGEEKKRKKTLKSNKLRRTFTYNDHTPQNKSNIYCLCKATKHLLAI
jgi:hypothetical protein